MRSTFSKSQVIIARLLLVLLLLESCSHANISFQPQPAREIKEISVAHNSLKQVATSTTSDELQVSKTSVPSNSEITYANDKQNLEPIGSNRDLMVQQKDRLTSRLQSNGQQTHLATGHHIVKDNKLRSSIAREQHLASNHKAVVDKKAAREGAKTKESLIELLINQICIIKGGHKVNFKQQENGELIAIVKENCPQGFSKTHMLPVYIVPGLNYSEKAVKAPVWQQQFIYFTPKGIWIGQPGLLGGGKDKKGKGKEEGDPEAEPTEWKEETKRGGTTSSVRYGKKELKSGEHSVLSAFFNSLIEKDKKLPVDLDKVKLSKESIKSLWHVGQGVGEEHYRNRALKLLALDAINKGKDYTAGYLKKLAKLGTIPTIVEHNQAALPADWCSKSTDELEEILYKLYSQALEAMEQRLAQLPIDMQAAYQVNILQLQYYFQRLLETSHPLKTSIIQKIQTDLDSLSLLPMGEEIKLRRAYLTYLTQARDNINLEKDLARIKKYIEKVAELGKKGKSKAKNTSGVEWDILRRFSGKLFREAGDLSKRLAENPQQVGKSLDWQRSYYLQASKLGDKIAYYKLGMLYADSEHTDYYDIDEAKEALEESAGEGYVLACYSLAVHYEKTQNNKLALAWHKRAAEKDHPASLYKLYQSYKEGKEVTQAEGIKYLEQAGILGHKEAQHELGTYYWEQGDYKRAVDWHKKAAFQGIQASYSCLGLAATKGLGHPKDKQAALEYYLKSGVKMEDSPDLQYAKGRSYEKGAGVEKNLETALTLYNQASELGHQKAAYHAGLVYLQSKMLADEMKKAYEPIYQAAQQGYPKACLLLGRMYEYGFGVTLDPAASIKWYNQALLGDRQDAYTRASALHHLGWLHKLGKGIEPNEEAGLSLLEQASKEGRNRVNKSEVGNEGSAQLNEGEEASRITSFSLHTAVEIGDLSKVAKLLSGPKVNINAKRDIDIASPLHIAAEKDLVEIARILIEKGAKLNSTNMHGNTPLHEAIKKGHIETAKLLLDKGADVNAKGEWGKYVPLYESIKQGELEIAKLLIRKGADVNPKFQFDICNLVPLAIEKGSLELARLLIEKGASVDNFYICTIRGGASVRGARGGEKELKYIPILSWAIERGYVEIVKLLIERGIDINAKTNDEATPLDIAFDKDYTEIVKLLLEKGADANAKNKNGETLLHRAVGEGHLVVVKLLLEKGADIHAKDSSDSTPLHMRVGRRMRESIVFGAPLHAVKEYKEEEYMEVVKLLLEKGANVNVQDIHGRTPLYWAAQNGYTEIVKLLLEKGADVNARDNDGNTPLHWAVGACDLEIVKLLLEKGANENHQDNNSITPLHSAVKTGNIELIKLLLEKGANLENSPITTISSSKILTNEHIEIEKLLLKKGINVYIKDNDGNTTLSLAAQQGDFESVKLLISKGANINPKIEQAQSSSRPTALFSFTTSLNKLLTTPLHEAVRGNYTEIAEFLLNHGADVHAKDIVIDNYRGYCYDNTPLHIAIQNGHLAIFKLLLDHGAKIEERNGNGDTSLSIAARGGNIEIFKYLIEKRVNVPCFSAFGAPAGPAKGEDDNTLLCIAAREGHVEIFKFLVGKGANVNAKDNDGNTPLHLAAKKGCTEIVELLIQQEVGVPININSLLYLAVEGGHTGLVRLLIEKGADIHAKYRDGNTPLHIAVEKEYIEIVKILLEKGADINIEINEDYRVIKLISYYAKRGNIELVKLLTEKGADINVKDGMGYTPLYWACEEGHLEVVKLLIQQEVGVPININPLLRLAARGGHTQLVKLLIGKGADVNARNRDGNTSLHWAAEKGHIEVVKLLLEKGANVNVQDIHGRTPLYWAAQYGYTEIVKLLLEKEADVNAKDNDGKTPLHSAALKGHSEVVKLLNKD